MSIDSVHIVANRLSDSLVHFFDAERWPFMFQETERALDAGIQRLHDPATIAALKKLDFVAVFQPERLADLDWDCHLAL
ncbi:MAG TPA: hypothetical protein VHR44_07935 [Beijerinckiaceae bacterium]|nr:hypothetical protein [Beijerinckiaceae bacterium]